MDTLTFVLVASLLVIVYTYYRTMRSGMSKDRKIAVYVVSIIIPILGLILFFVFNRNRDRAIA